MPGTNTLAYSVQTKKKKVFIALKSGPNVIILFTTVIYKFAKKARVFMLDKSFQPCLMFVDKAGAYPKVEQLKCTSLG